MRRMLLATLLSMTVVGCAGTRTVAVPNERRVEAVASLRAAEEAGAARIPEAARHLEFARQQIADAQRLQVEGEDEAAELRLMQADADADLALALTRSVPAQEQARRTTEQAEALRRSLQ